MNEAQTNILRLINRSESNNGWYSVSPPIMKMIEQHLQDELFETKEEEGKIFLKLTSEGEALLKYL